jgi:hypothetical protein
VMKRPATATTNIMYRNTRIEKGPIAGWLYPNV